MCIRDRFNILDNAVKYTPEGGQIRVSVESWEMYVKIDIADTGIGISEQHQGAIFKRFYREMCIRDSRFPRGEIYDLLTTKPEDAANGKQAE